MTLLKAALGLAASAFMNDAVVRPRQMGRLARDYCDRAGKPLLLMTCRGLTQKMMGVPVRAEAETDRAYPVRAPDKAFGAVLVVGVLERQVRPDLAMREWRRVADRVFVVVPSWFAPHTWLDPTHRWVIDPKVKVAAPLWNGQQHVRLLEVSDNGYGGPPWTKTNRSARPSGRPQPPPSPPSSTRSPSPSNPSPYGAPLLPNHHPPETSSGVPVPDLRTQHSGSSSCASHLMVVSTPDFDESW